MAKSEPKFCPDCPFPRQWINLARQKLLDKQMTRIKEEPTPLQICIELRRITKNRLFVTCPYYPAHENIGLYCEVKP